MDKHKDMLCALADLTDFGKDAAIKYIKEQQQSFKSPDFIKYWRALVFDLPSRTKIILGLVKDDVISVEFLIEILELTDQTIFSYALEAEDFPKLLSLFRYLFYDQFLGYRIFNGLNLDIMGTLKCLNLESFFFGKEERKNISIGGGKIIDLSHNSKCELFMKHNSKYKNDTDIILTQTSRILSNRLIEFNNEIENLIVSLEDIISGIVESNMETLIKVHILSFLAAEDMQNLKLIFSTEYEIEMIALFLEHFLSSEQSFKDDRVFIIKESLKEKPNKSDISKYMLPFTEIEQGIFFEIFGISRLESKIKPPVDNKLKELVKKRQFTEIERMSNTEFLKEFFELVEPSVSHFLVYTEELKRILVERFRNDEFKNMFCKGVEEVSGDRISYRNVVEMKLKKAGLFDG
ncbi:hypothetical protein CDIK_0510 [Cucumispora dikerogammari]|nr:hypothetical protein CDIK_0510 [Cucumispora dikerogammari]